MKKVIITKSCVWAEGQELDLHESTAQTLIDIGYAKEISSGQSGQANTDKKKKPN